MRGSTLSRGPRTNTLPHSRGGPHHQTGSYSPASLPQWTFWSCSGCLAVFSFPPAAAAAVGTQPAGGGLALFQEPLVFHSASSSHSDACQEKGRQLRRGTLCPACPGHFPLAHSHHPAPGCFALVLPAAPSSCLSEAPKRDCANVFAAGTGSFHRWALFLYWNMRLWTTGPLEEQALLALSLPRPPLPLSTWQSLSLLRQQPLSQARNVTPSRQSGGILCFGQLLLKLLLKGDTRLGLAVAWTSAHAPAC